MTNAEMEQTRKTYQRISEANITLGLSMNYLRKGCKAGTIPHIMCGNRYLINIPELMKQLNLESMEKITTVNA